MEIENPYFNRICEWASREDAIRAIVITGSQARDDGSADAYSDLDIQVITTDIKRYTDDDRWLDALGKVWIRFPLYQDVPYRLVWFGGGIKVDFQFVTLDDIRPMIKSGTLSDEYQRGYRVVLDKDDLYRAMPPSPRTFPQPPPPTAEAIHASINEFWFEAVHVAQFIRRREFWVVKYRDWTIKLNLLRMLEWHARARHQEASNTWLLGKRIRHWAGEEDYATLRQIWTGWDAADLWHGLIIQLELFRRLCTELTSALNHDYADETFQEIEAYIRRLWREDDAPSARD